MAIPNKIKPVSEYRVNQSGCWVWNGTRYTNGYGRKSQNGTSVRAHRVYYEKFKGPIPDGLQIDHLCRVRLCVNPTHLEAVTHEENGRRGIFVKINMKAANEIRTLYRLGFICKNALGFTYGLNPAHIHLILKNKRWRAN